MFAKIYDTEIKINHNQIILKIQVKQKRKHLTIKVEDLKKRMMKKAIKQFKIESLWVKED